MTAVVSWPVRKGEDASQTVRRGPDLDRLKRIADYLKRNPALVQKRLRSITHDADQLALVASRSYWHVNGFAKLRIIEDPRLSARLHVWPTGPDRIADVDPHGHRWEFASWVTAGEGIVERFYLETDEDDDRGQPYLCHDYLRRADGTGTLNTRRTSWLWQADERQRKLGDIYGCSTERVHTVGPRGINLVATVVLQGPERVDSTKVFRNGPHMPAALEGELRVDDLKQLLTAVERAMQHGR